MILVNNITNMQSWKKGEEIVQNYLIEQNMEVKEVSLEDQYKDIDWWVHPKPFGKPFSVSVKYQPAALKYGNLAVEYWLLSDNGAKMPGNFQKCEADYIAIVVPIDSVKHSIEVWETKVLHEKVPELAHRKDVLLTLSSKATNTGRKFNQSSSHLVRRKDLDEFRIAATIVDLV